MDQDEARLPSREKYWSEIDDKEKIERLRSEIKSMDIRLYESRNLIEKLLIHVHLENGNICVPLDEVKYFPPNFERRLPNRLGDDEVYI